MTRSQGPPSTVRLQPGKTIKTDQNLATTPEKTPTKESTTQYRYTEESSIKKFFNGLYLHTSPSKNS